jgi:hypothetical protein
VIKSRKRRWVGHVAHTGEMRNVTRILVAKPEVMRPVGRPRCARRDNNRMAQDRDQWQDLVIMKMNLWVP